MKTVEEIRAMFEPKTKNGSDFVILGVKAERFTMALCAAGGEWVLVEVDHSGKIPCLTHCESLYDLVPIKPAIDYSKLPKNVLCRVGYEEVRRYSTGRGHFYLDGKDSSTGGTHVESWFDIKIIDNPVRPNHDDSLEHIPRNVKVRVWDYEDEEEVGLAQDYFEKSTEFIWYQILAED